MVRSMPARRAVEGFVPQQILRFARDAAGRDGIAIVLQHAGATFAQRRFVLDDQNPDRRVGGRRCELCHGPLGDRKVEHKVKARAFSLGRLVLQSTTERSHQPLRDGESKTRRREGRVAAVAVAMEQIGRASCRERV